jgi:putative copper resistance protein D
MTAAARGLLSPSLYACRFVQLALAMVVFGGTAFRFYALGGGAALGGTAFEGWLRRVVLVSAVFALVLAVALLLCQSAAMAGSTAAAFDPETVAAVLLETRFGCVWRWHLLIAIVLVLACGGRPRRRPPLILILSFRLLASLGWIGHAAMDEGAAQITHELNQTLHLLAARLWLGGLVPLAWLIRRARDAVAIALVREAVGHFSRMGYIAVGLLAVTGAVNTAFVIGDLPAVFDTPYGRLLVAKIMLFLAMVAVALTNRFRFAPRISRDVAALGRTVALEQVLGLSILAAVSVLGTLPPGVHGGGH